MYFSWVTEHAQRTPQLSKMMSWLVFISLCTTSILGITTEDSNVDTTYFSNSVAVNATLNRISNAALAPCGDTLSGFGYVRSPNYPSDYVNNVDCYWTLYASPNTENVVLQFYSLNTTACCDHVSIYNSSGYLVMRYSGAIVPPTMVLPHSAVIHLHTDGSLVSSGFSLLFSTSDVAATTVSPLASCESQGGFYCASSFLCIPMSHRCDGNTNCDYGDDETGCSTATSLPRFVSASCGNTLNGSGNVSSPNYPSDYVNNLDCYWRLYASPNTGNVVLQFYALSMTACCDYVSIYNSSGYLVMRYSGTIIPPTMVIPYSALIYLHTDGSLVSSGLSLSFSTSDVSATDVSPLAICDSQGGFYCASSYLCIPMSYRCNGNASCGFDDDKTGCRITSHPPIFTYTTCVHTLYGSGYVRSPNYPSDYINNLDCYWRLYASPNTGNVVLQFYALSTTECCDYVSIYNSSRHLVIRYSGTIVPPTMVIPHSALIHLHTDGSLVSSGYSLWFSTSDVAATTVSPLASCESQGGFYCASLFLCIPMSYRCDGNTNCGYGEDETGCSTATSLPRSVSASCGDTLYGSGYVSSPNYPSDYGNNLDCYWTLVASPDIRNVLLQFYALSMTACCDYVSIYNSSGYLVMRYSGTIVPPTMVLPHSALIHLHTDGSLVSSGFSLLFSTSDVSATAESPLASCENHGRFYCASSHHCIPMSYRCNGHTNCVFGDDETGCSTMTPPTASATLSERDSCELEGNFYCASSYVCVAWSQRCNGYSYCHYGEDEDGCSTVAPTTAASTISARYSCELQGNFYCASSNFCISMSLRCNGYSDCYYAEDEVGCSTVVPTPTASASSSRDSCLSQGKFYCEIEGICIYSSWRCDGASDCLYNEDELGCTSRTSTSSPTTSSTSSCGGTLYGSGYVRSPNFPSNYGNYLNCTWTLYASPYYGSIMLEFNAFSTEAFYDYLSIYDSSGALVNRYSGTTNPNSIVLGSTAVVRFTTDGAGNLFGFSIFFSTSVATTTTLSPRDSCEQQGYFYCALSNLCIASLRRCDGYIYCSYGEDEAGCISSSTSRTPLVTPSQRDSCLRQGNFYCEFSRDCIAMWRRCDGYAYCYYGEDESGCVNTTATSRPAASEQHQGSFIAASGNAQLFLQLGNSSASKLPRGSWIVVSGYVTALLLGFPRFCLQ